MGKVVSGTLYVKETTSSAHRLPGHPKCGRDVHGHSFKWEVWITGSGGDDKMLIDVGDVKKAIRKYDHVNLNRFFSYPSMENLAPSVVDEISRLFEKRNGHPPKRIKLRVWETEDAYFEVER